MSLKENRTSNEAITDLLYIIGKIHVTNARLIKSQGGQVVTFAMI